MAEKLATIPTIEGQEAPKDALSELIKKLGISPELEQSIRGLKGEKKDRCILDLEDIAQEMEEKKLGNMDREQKIKKTLEDVYGISIKVSDLKEAQSKDAERHEKLQENLESVKKLDPTIVSKELENAKTANPLPEDVKLKIAKSSNIAPDKIDAAIQKNDNPQVKNLVDTYYLIQGGTIDGIIKKLSPEKKGEAIMAFGDLRASAREFGLSSSERADNVKALIMNQSNTTQNKVIETVKSLTKDSPDTMITRTGDRLTFSDPKNERYTYDIDMAKRPLELSKQLSGLTISRELGETRDPAREENKKTRDNVDRLVTGINLKKNEILNGTLKDGTKIISEGFSESEGFGGSIKNTLSQIKLGTVEAAGTSQIMIEAGLVSINSEKKRLEQLIKDKTGKDNLNSDLDSDIGAIRGTLRGIDTMIESFNKLKDECKKIQKEDPKNDHTQWENNTNRTLRDLVSLGFDELGQKNLNTLIKTISEQNGNRGIWEGGKLDITGKKLDQQLVYLEKFVGNLREKSGKNERETFQELRVRIASFADFRKDRWESGTFIAGFLPNKDTTNNSTVTAQNTSGESMKKPL